MTFALDEQALAHELRYELLLRVNANRLCEEAHASPREVDVALVLQNADAKRTRVLHRINLVRLPPRFEGTVPKSNHGPRRTKLQLVAFLNRSRPASKDGRAAWRVGSTLAERHFTIGLSADNLFRVHWSSFREMGWESYALWHLEMKDPDMLLAAAEPDDVLQIHLNEDLPALVALWSPAAMRNQRLGPIAALVRPLMTAEIFAEIGDVVLRYLNSRQRDGNFDPSQLDRDSLAAAVVAGLRKATRRAVADLLTLATEDTAKLHMSIHQAVAVGKAYDQATLERIRS